MVNSYHIRSWIISDILKHDHASSRAKDTTRVEAAAATILPPYFDGRSFPDPTLHGAVIDSFEATTYMAMSTIEI